MRDFIQQLDHANSARQLERLQRLQRILSIAEKYENRGNRRKAGLYRARAAGSLSAIIDIQKFNTELMG